MKEFTLQWLGQGGYALRIDGTALYLDPYLSDMVERVDGPRRLVAPPIKPEDARPGYFLATHEHMDHLDLDLISQMDCAGVVFICPESCVSKLLALAVAQEQIKIIKQGNVLNLGCCKLKAVFADHTPGSVGFVINAHGKAIYFTGDTLYHDAVGTEIDCDVTCCCINGRWGNMNAEEALRVALRSGAKLAIPNHYGMFAENNADPAIFCALAEQAGLKTYTMGHGEEIPLI